MTSGSRGAGPAWALPYNVCGPMPKSKVRIIPISPLTLRCPRCGAKPNKHCKTSGGKILRYALGIRARLIHVARIKKAARMDAAEPA